MFKAGLIFCIIVVAGLIATSSADDNSNKLNLIRRSEVDAHSDNEYMPLTERFAILPPKKRKYLPGSLSLLSKREKELIGTSSADDNSNKLNLIRRSEADAHSDDEYMSLTERSAILPPKKRKYLPGSLSLLSKREKGRLLSTESR
ncbi:tachykinin-2-like [Octopus sinensis]|uniref:Tachykinin-2-like n=1 Tax=Octopus sinensis TaxID=2607531 RepID=A0A7E6EPH8_9MOLL|nr:tachykinin-2-like [Octopus sinensis]